MPLPRCFFDFSINGIPTGRIVFELFTDVCPKTCQNFKLLCTGEKGEGKTTFKPLHYKGTPVHRIVKGFIIQGGDFENGDGSGGESVYGGLFKDENFKLKHDGPFLLSMANKGPNTNGSQYFITTRSAPHLDGIHVVFGRVVSGDQFVTEIENQKVDSKSRPYADMRITNCGELVLLKKGKVIKNKSKVAEMTSDSDASSDGDSVSSSSSEEERKRRKRKRRRKKNDRGKKRKKTSKKKKRRSKKKESSNSSSESESSLEEPVQGVAVSSTITEGDLPPEIVDTSRKSWLYRYSKSPSPVDGETKKKKKEQPQVGGERLSTVSSSGRTLKGRGNMRYRTPPPRDYRWNNYQSRRRSPDRNQYRQRSLERDRYRQRSPERDRYRQRSPERGDQKSPERDRQRSPERDRHSRRSPDRDRQRSPERDHHSRRSPDRDRQKSPDRDRHSRRSPDRDRHSKRSPDTADRVRQRSPERDHHNRRSPDGDHHNRSPDRRQRSPIRDYERQEIGRPKDDKKTKNNSTEEKEKSSTPTPLEKKTEDDGDMTPPLYEQEKYWSNVAAGEETGSKYRDNKHSSKWDRGVANGSGTSSDEDNELESAYQKVEQTLAEQQFGITALMENI